MEGRGAALLAAGHVRPSFQEDANEGNAIGSCLLCSCVKIRKLFIFQIKISYTYLRSTFLGAAAHPPSF